MHTVINIDYLKQHRLILLEAVSGSRAYGLATPESDLDIKGVFYLPKDLFYTNEYIEQVSNDRNDIVYYEIGRYVELLSKNNPNMLELLCTPDKHILYKHPVMYLLLPEYFLSKIARATFAGYALSQIKKATGLNKKINNPIAKTRKTIIDFCYILSGNTTLPVKDWLQQKGIRQEDTGLVKLHHTQTLYALHHKEGGGYKGIVKDTASHDLQSSSVDRDSMPLAYLYCNKDAYSAHCKEHTAYWDWMDKRNEERHKGNLAHGQGYDAKNMMHTIRLLQQAKTLFVSGRLAIECPNREALLGIKAGQWSYEELIEYAEQLMEEITVAYSHSPLPECPDPIHTQQLLLTMRKTLYG